MFNVNVNFEVMLKYLPRLRIDMGRHIQDFDQENCVEFETADLRCLWQYANGMRWDFSKTRQLQHKEVHFLTDSILRFMIINILDVLRSVPTWAKSFLCIHCSNVLSFVMLHLTKT